MKASKFAVLFVALMLTLVSPVASAVERLRTLWMGQWVEYIEVGDYAVTEGDIIIGPKDTVREWTRVAQTGWSDLYDHPKALTVDKSALLWMRGTSGLIEIPYVIEAGNVSNINGAVAEANRALSGVLQWLPRTTQTDYVAFNLTLTLAGFCQSSIGRIGGRQQITGEVNCSQTSLLHEMGHSMGLLHSQTDADAGAFVDLFLTRMDPAHRGNNKPVVGTRTFNGYDYLSIMHYERNSFPAYVDGRATLETKPAGIDLRAVYTYSPGDIDALKRLYGTAPTITTVTTNPEGLKVVIDGVQVTTPVSFPWRVGNVHRAWVGPELQVKDGYSFAFGRWSHDASSTPSTQLTWQVTAGDGALGSPSSAPASTVLTANFVRLIDVTPTPPSQAGGTTSVTPRSPAWPGHSTLYPQYSVFDLRALPSAGYLHSFGYAAGATVSHGGLGIIPNLTVEIGEAVAAQTIGATFSNAKAIAVNALGDGILDTILLTQTSPAGAQASVRAPRVLQSSAGNWKYQMDSPQIVGSSIRHIFDGFDGFDNNTTGEVAMPSSGVRTVNIRAHRELNPYTQVIPACAGTITLGDTSEWLRYGATVLVTLRPTTSAIFTGWTGTISDTIPVGTVTIGTAVPEFVANFNTSAERLQLNDIAPKILGDDSVATSIVISGTGFTATTQVIVDGSVRPSSFVDAHTLRVTLSRNAIASSGRLAVYVRNSLTSSCSVASNSLALDVLPTGQNLTITLVEYYQPGLDYYFLTGRPGDKATLDGLPAIWSRTGKQIKVFAVPNVDTTPLERHYFDKVARGGTRGSHFFTALASDTVLLTSLNPTNTQAPAKPYLEGVEGYAVPVGGTNACPVGTAPVYRAFKGAPRYVDDGNHRFSTSAAQHQDMVTRLGWIDEGVKFCSVI